MIGGLSLNGSDGRFVSVTEELPHPDYNFDTDVNDIMVVGLEERIQNIPLQALNFDKDIPASGTETTVIGLGFTSEEGEFADVLQEVKVKVVDFETCNAAFGRIRDDIMLCAGFLPNGGRDSCQGDSGGPLLMDNQFQVGIVSFGEGCARPNTPAVYARVSAFEEWIAQGICKVSSNPPSTCDPDVPTLSPVLASDGPQSLNSMAPARSTVPSQAPSAINATTSMNPAVADTLAPTPLPVVPDGTTSPILFGASPTSTAPNSAQPSVQLTPTTKPSVTEPATKIPSAATMPTPRPPSQSKPNGLSPVLGIAPDRPVTKPTRIHSEPNGLSPVLETAPYRPVPRPTRIHSVLSPTTRDHGPSRYPSPLLDRLRTSPPIPASLPTVPMNTPVITVNNPVIPINTPLLLSLLRSDEQNPSRYGMNDSRKGSKSSKKNRTKKKDKKRSSDKR